MIIDYSEVKSTDRYKIMAQSIVPRPIAWIVTESNNNTINIAPFSYFTPLSSEPATMIISIGHKKDGSEKDTLRNIKESKKCTICITPSSMLETMNSSAESLEYGDSEADKFNIKTNKIKEDFPPIIDGVESAFFCSFMKIVELDGENYSCNSRGR